MEFTSSKEMQTLHTTAAFFYHEFQHDRHFIPSSRAYLFNWQEQDVVNMGRDSLACWIRLVEEAQLTTISQAEHKQSQLRRTLSKFLKVRKPKAVSAVLLKHSPQSRLALITADKGAVGLISISQSSIRRQRHRVTVTGKTIAGVKSLSHYGFIIRYPRKSPDINALPWQLADYSARKTDFSGTLVSTSP
jgi:hypothetical protein